MADAKFKACTICAAVKPLFDFHHRVRNGRDYWTGPCRVCANAKSIERHREWYARNADRARSYSRDYYQANKDRCAQSVEAYKRSHIEWWRAYQREYQKKRRAAAKGQ